MSFESVPQQPPWKGSSAAARPRPRTALGFPVTEMQNFTLTAFKVLYQENPEVSVWYQVIRHHITEDCSISTISDNITEPSQGGSVD